MIPEAGNYIFNTLESGNLFHVNFKNRFYFLTELSSQFRSPQHPESSNQPSTSGEAEANVFQSALPYGTYEGGALPRGVFYQTANNEYRPIQQNFGGVVRGGHIIGRYDHGILRPIFNQYQDMIVVNAETHVPYRINSAQAAELGINLPISRADINRARSAGRGRNFRNRHPRK